MYLSTRFLFLVFVISPCVIAAEVYRNVDEDGNLIFSDRKTPGAVKQATQKPAAVKPPIQKSKAPSQVEPESIIPAPAAEEFSGYKALNIIQPLHDVAIRNNAGTVVIAADISPGLARTLGHTLVPILDSKQLDLRFDSNSFSIPNVDRGTHSLQLLIVNERTGETLISSEPVTFHLLRFVRN